MTVHLAQREPESSDVFAVDLDAVRVFSGRDSLAPDLFDATDEAERHIDDEGAVFAPVGCFEVQLVVGDRHVSFV